MSIFDVKPMTKKEKEARIILQDLLYKIAAMQEDTSHNSKNNKEHKKGDVD